MAAANGALIAGTISTGTCAPITIAIYDGQSPVTGRWMPSQ
jgi:hypothetical protein